MIEIFSPIKERGIVGLMGNHELKLYRYSNLFVDNGITRKEYFSSVKKELESIIKGEKNIKLIINRKNE